MVTFHNDAPRWFSTLLSRQRYSYHILHCVILPDTTPHVADDLHHLHRLWYCVDVLFSGKVAVLLVAVMELVLIIPFGVLACRNIGVGCRVTTLLHRENVLKYTLLLLRCYLDFRSLSGYFLCCRFLLLLSHRAFLYYVILLPTLVSGLLFPFYLMFARVGAAIVRVWRSSAVTAIDIREFHPVIVSSYYWVCSCWMEC